jgi:hypothetical protein
MFTQQNETLQLLAKLFAALPQQTASVAAPPIVTVVAAQTDAKKVAFQRVRAILQLFDPDLKALAWKVTERDQSNEPTGYDMEKAADRVRDIIVERGGRFASQPSKTFISNCSLLLFDYAGEGLSLDDFNIGTTKKIGESWDRFSSAFMNMSQIMRKYVNESLGSAMDSLYMNLLNIHSRYPAFKTSALMYVTHQLLGKLRQMDLMPDRDSVTREVATILQLEETSPVFQQIFNQEMMAGVGDKRVRADGTPSPVKTVKLTKGTAVPTRPALQGAAPCYGWIKQLDCCKGPTCNAKKRAGTHPHKFDPLDRGAPEKAFTDWVKTYM